MDRVDDFLHFVFNIGILWTFGFIALSGFRDWCNFKADKLVLQKALIQTRIDPKTLANLFEAYATKSIIDTSNWQVRSGGAGSAGHRGIGGGGGGGGPGGCGGGG